MLSAKQNKHKDAKAPRLGEIPGFKRIAFLCFRAMELLRPLLLEDASIIDAG